MRATYTRTQGVRHLFAAYDLSRDKLYGHVKDRKTRREFLEFCRYIRSLYPRYVRIAIIADNFSPHLTSRAARSSRQCSQETGASALAPERAGESARSSGRTIRRWWWCMTGSARPLAHV
jgi:hypothetical protein